MKEQSIQVRRRRVFHIPGFDPQHPRRYRELYRTESAAQAEISGYDIAIKANPSAGRFGWTVAAHIDDCDVVADVDVLVWSDIVRDSMKSSIPATYLQLVQTAWIYITTGTLWRVMRTRKGPVIAALFPVAFLLAQLAFALVAGSVLGGLAGEAAIWLAQQAGAEAGAPWVGVAVDFAVFFALVVLILRWFKANDNKVFAYYLMHDYAFSARFRGGNPPLLEARISEFEDKIAEAFTDDVEEVLVVGHSSGAHVAVCVLADLIRSGRVPANGPKLAFLSLGQAVPMASFLPEADRLRGALAYLSASDLITWVDVTAPGDGCSFALCDPVAVSGVSPPDQKWPLVISAAFTKTMSAESWAAIRWRFFRVHFQYLCAFDRPKGYDYFKITAGPLTLADRYRRRKPSKSVMRKAISKYTSVRT